MFGSKKNERVLNLEILKDCIIVNGRQDHDRVVAKYPFNVISIVSEDIIKKKLFTLAGEERSEILVLKDDSGNCVNPAQLSEIKVIFVHKTFRDVIVRENL